MKKETKQKIKSVLKCKRFYTQKQLQRDNKNAVVWANYYFNDVMPC